MSEQDRVGVCQELEEMNMTIVDHHDEEMRRWAVEQAIRFASPLQMIDRQVLDLANKIYLFAVGTKRKPTRKAKK